MSSTATELVSVSDKDGGPRGRKGTPNRGSEGRALEATVPAKAVLAATAEAIQAVRIVRQEITPAVLANRKLAAA